MESSIVIAGFGGQGVLFAGKLLAHAGMDYDYHVTWIPSYGPEMRGGTANCTVIMSSDPIGSPIVSRPRAALVLNEPSFDKYEPMVMSGGLLVVNESIVPAHSLREDIETVYVPANRIAEELGSVKMLNMVMVGAMIAAQPVLPITVVEQALAENLPENKEALLTLNCQALRRGYEWVHS